jgi:hypothetical protein
MDGEDQELKTETSRRNVPIHEELIRFGFLDFVEAGRKALRRLPEPVHC